MHPALSAYLHSRLELSPSSAEMVARCFQPQVVRRQQVLLREGEVAQHLYLVASGCLRVFLSKNDGNESTRFLLFPGEIGTALPSFVHCQPSTATVQSLGAGEVLLLSRPDQQRLAQQVPGWETLQYKALEESYVACIERLEGLLMLSAKERYQALLQQHPQLVQRLPSRIVAEYLGISYETLSRIKAQR